MKNSIETSLCFREVWSAGVRKYNYFPDGYTTLPCHSFSEIDSFNDSGKNHIKSITEQIKEVTFGWGGK